jgi:peptide-methionine (S)-S-oxide reductase
VTGPEQERVAKAYLAQLEGAHAFSRPIVTRIDPAGPFFPAEAYHQDYLDRHPDTPYIAINDIPKVNALRTLFPANWRPNPVKVDKLASGD